MNRTAFTVLTALAIAAGLSHAALAAAPTKTSAAAGTVDPALAKQAHVSLDAARVIALKARPGQVTDQELEREAGGSGLRYSFDIKSHGVVYEVGVDAQSGKVLENLAEGPHPD